MRVPNLVSTLAGLGALVGLHTALQHPSTHIQMLGRSGRAANIEPITSNLQTNVSAHIVMLRCDVNLTEEVASVEYATSADVLMQVIHSGDLQ